MSVHVLGAGAGLGAASADGAKDETRAKTRSSSIGNGIAATARAFLAAIVSQKGEKMRPFSFLFELLSPVFLLANSGINCF